MFSPHENIDLFHQGNITKEELDRRLGLNNTIITAGNVCITCECGHLEIDIDAELPKEITEYVCNKCGQVIIYEPPQEKNYAKNKI